MKVPTSLGIITALLFHFHLLPMVLSAHHTTIASNTSSTGFSFPLIANNEGLDHTVHRSNDGFLRLQHNLCTDLLPSSDTNCSVAKVNSLTPNMTTPVVRMPHELRIRLDTNPHEYILKVDSSSRMSWLQCNPCQPHANQYNPIFDPSTSSTFRNVTGTSHLCVPPFHSVFSGRLCNFQLTNPSGMLVEGFLAQDKLSVNHVVIRENYVFGCSHSTENFQSQNRYAGIMSISAAPTSLVMQVANQGVTQFSYCLFKSSKTTNRQGFLRFGTDIPRNPHYKTTKILPALNDHDFEYYVRLVGISLGTLKLDKIRPEMFARSKDGQGGCVVDLGTSLTMMVREAYYIVEEAVWSDLQRYGAERVKRPGFSLCFRATNTTMRHLQSISLHFPEEETVMVLSPEQLFLMMEDEQGKTACFAITPGHRTVIGALQQMDTRLVYDVKDSTLSFVSESCAEDTIQME